MDHNEFSAFDWSTETSPHFQRGFASLSNAFDYDEPLGSAPLQPTSAPKDAVDPLACAPIAAPMTVRNGEHEQLKTMPPAQNIPAGGPSRWTPVTRIPGSECDDAQSLSESSTHPGDSSDAAITTPARRTRDAGPTLLSASDRASSPKRRRRVAKEEDHFIFDKALLQDLKGTTAARSKLMSADERSVMLHKRRLRNRASAARSREKQRSAVRCLSDQVDSLTLKIYDLQQDCISQQEEIRILREQNNVLRAAVSVRSSFLQTS
jgi:hypothetical protein